MHFTIADVRAGSGGLGAASGAALACVAWMAVVSFLMCSCCETLGAMLGLPTSVVGITFSAIGTSLPNLIASMVAAHQNLGNMARRRVRAHRRVRARRASSSSSSRAESRGCRLALVLRAVVGVWCHGGRRGDRGSRFASHPVGATTPHTEAAAPRLLTREHELNNSAGWCQHTAHACTELFPMTQRGGATTANTLRDGAAVHRDDDDDGRGDGCDREPRAAFGGAQAISNAFGSNTFNIFVGLGLPWAAYVATAGGGSYHALPDEGIVDSVAILIGTLVFFVGLLFANDFVLYPRHGYLFVAMYAAYLVYAVGKVYLVD